MLTDGRTQLLALLAFIALSRLVLVAEARTHDVDDGPRYLQEAINLRTYGTFSSDFVVPRIPDHRIPWTPAGGIPQPTTHDLPMFPLMLRGLLTVCKTVLLAAKFASILNCLLYGIAAAGVYGWLGC